MEEINLPKGWLSQQIKHTQEEVSSWHPTFQKGSIREIPVEGGRVESGPIRFVVNGHRDWKSLHVRGDDALAASMYWRIIKEELSEQQKQNLLLCINFLDGILEADIIEH